METFANLIKRFLIANGWIEAENEDNYFYFEKGDNVGIGVSESDNDICILDETGDIYHIPLDARCYNELIGYLIKHRCLACDFKNVEE